MYSKWRLLCRVMFMLSLFLRQGYSSAIMADEGCKELTYESLTKVALEVMRKKLPSYVVRCFVAAGYDTLQLIAGMDISKDNPDNAIHEIEEFVNKEQLLDTLLESHSVSGIDGHFKFPPGHRKAIELFVEDVRQMHGRERVRRKKRENSDSQSSCGITKKQRMTDDTDTADEPDDSTNQASVLGDIRRQVSKWARKQIEPKLSELKEHEHYEIHVEVNVDGKRLVSKIECKLCGKRYTLGNKNEGVLISNWTKHLCKCVNNPKKEAQTVNLISTLWDQCTTDILSLAWNQLVTVTRLLMKWMQACRHLVIMFQT